MTTYQCLDRGFLGKNDQGTGLKIRTNATDRNESYAKYLILRWPWGVRLPLRNLRVAKNRCYAGYSGRNFAVSYCEW